MKTITSAEERSLKNSIESLISGYPMNPNSTAMAIMKLFVDKNIIKVIPLPWIEEVRIHLINGEKLNAIKKYKDATGTDLKTAKDFIESLIPHYDAMRENNILMS